MMETYAPNIEPDPEVDVAPLPSGPNADFYIQQFVANTKKTAEAIIDLSTTLYAAECHLDKAEFLRFCGQVNIEIGKSYHKKLRSIGRSEKRLKKVSHLLPNCWTTIYKLSCLKEAEFRLLEDDCRLSPSMTAKVIDEALETYPNGRKKKRSYGGVKRTITIKWTGLSQDNRAEIYDVIREWVRRFSIKVIGENLLIDNQSNHNNGGSNG